MGRSGAWLAGSLAPAVLLVADPRGWSPFGPVKTLAVSVLGVVTVAVLVGGAGRLRLHRTAALLWTALLGWLTLAAAFGTDPLYAWVGTPERRLGLAAWLLFFGLFCAGQTLRSREDARGVVDGLVVAALGTGVWVLFEWWGHPPVAIDSTTDRLTGPVGSAALLGAVAALLAPVGVTTALDRNRAPWWRVVAGLGAMGAVAAAVGSATRAAWAGLAVAAIVVVALRWRSIADRARSGRTGAIGVAVVAGAMALAVALGVLAAGTDTLEDRLSMAQGNDGAARSRLAEWAVATRVVADHPVLGVGPEGYRIAAPGHVDAGYERRYGRAEIPDRAHSGVLDVAATGGVPAALLYAALLLVVAWQALRALRRGPLWLVGVAAALLAYGTQQLLLFPVLTIDAVAWLAAGMLVAHTAADNSLASIPVPRAVAPALAAVAVALAAAGVIDVVADRSSATALRAAAGGDLDDARRAGDRAAALRPDAVRYHLVAAEVETTSGRLDGMRAALGHVEDALTVSSQDPVARARRAELLLDIASITFAPEDLAGARQAWEELSASDPNNASHLLELGTAAARQGDVDEAERAWLAAEDLTDDETAPAVNLARLYLETGRSDLARAAAGRALDRQPSDAAAAELLSAAEAAQDAQVAQNSHGGSGGQGGQYHEDDRGGP